MTLFPSTSHTIWRATLPSIFARSAFLLSPPTLARRVPLVSTCLLTTTAYAKKNPELRNYKMAISQATVRGKRFWRVAAAGLDGRGAGGLCSAVKSRGGVCFAYAVGSLRSAPVMARAVVRPAAAPALKGPAGPSNARKK